MRHILTIFLFVIGGISYSQVSENSKILKVVWEDAPIGLHSAGLKQRDTAHPIIYAGIQSAIRKGGMLFGRRDIIFIDEAHLISNDDSSMYLTFLATMKLINPLVILRILSTILLIESISFLACLPVSLIYKEPLYIYYKTQVLPSSTRDLIAKVI